MGNSPIKLKAHLVKIDLLKTDAIPEIEQLFKDAHTVKKSGAKLEEWPIVGEDCKVFMKAVFEYCYGEYSDAKKGRSGDIVHPAEIDAIKKVLKDTLDPANKKEVTIAVLKKELKKLVDDTDYN